MAEVEDVTRVAGVVLQHVLDTDERHITTGEHEGWIEVALDDRRFAEPAPSLADRRTPVESDHGRTGSMHRLEQVTAGDAEVNARHIRMTRGELGEHTARVGKHECVVVGRRERSRPRVEQLEGVRSVLQLKVDERDGRVGQAFHQPVPELGVGMDQRFGVLVGAARLSLDEVAGDGERSAGEGEHRRLARQLASNELDRLGDEVDVAGLESAKAVEVGRLAERLLGDGTGAGLDVDAEPHGVGRHDDVAVEHGGVDAVPVHWLERDLGGELGLLDRVEDRPVTAHLPVLGQMASCLAHEPHRRVRRRPTYGRVEKRGGSSTHVREDAIRPPVASFRAMHGDHAIAARRAVNRSAGCCS